MDTTVGWYSFTMKPRTTYSGVSRWHSSLKRTNVARVKDEVTDASVRVESLEAPERRNEVCPVAGRVNKLERLKGSKVRLDRHHVSAVEAVNALENPQDGERFVFTVLRRRRYERPTGPRSREKVASILKGMVNGSVEGVRVHLVDQL